MPLVIPNTTVLDVYDDTTTFGGVDVLAGGYVVVANNPVVAQLMYGPGAGQARLGPEAYLNPAVFPIMPGSRDPVAGIRFRNHIAGSPAQVFGLLYYPGEPSFGAGQPFLQQVSATGAVSTALVGLDGGAASANVALAVATQVIPGTLLNFTVAGVASEILVIGSFDMVITGAGTGVLAGSCLIDGVGLGGEALWGEGPLNERGNVSQTWVQSIGAGAHTVQLAARKSAAAGIGTVIAGNTRIALMILDQ